jgi:dTDP-4-dehydrorhamnose reductase
MKIALIGANGQLGSDLSKNLDKDTTSILNYPDFDITKPESMAKVLHELNPAVVINTASFNRVDECEEFPQQAIDVNAKDTPNPLNIYGQTKLDGEQFVRGLLNKYFLIRTCGLYGEAGCWGKGYNFVDAMVHASEENQVVRVVNNQTVTPTSTAELAERVLELIQTQEFGLFHMTSEGHCTWFEFAKTIFKLLGRDVELIPVDSNEYGAAAVRPSYSVLDNWKARSIGLTPFSHWTKALEDYLIAKGYLT